MKEGLQENEEAQKKEKKKENKIISQQRIELRRDRGEERKGDYKATQKARERDKSNRTQRMDTGGES